MEWLSVVMEEYKSLRNESLTAMETQQSILRFGTATLGIVLATGFNLWEKPILPEFLFLVMVPIVSYLVLFIWMGEVARMMRAGIFIVEIEKKVNKEFSDRSPALSWESWLRNIQKKDKKTPQLKQNYKAIIAIFLLISLFSVGLGNYKLSCPIGIRAIINVVEFAWLFTVAILIYYQGKRFK